MQVIVTARMPSGGHRRGVNGHGVLDVFKQRAVKVSCVETRISLCSPLPVLLPINLTYSTHLYAPANVTVKLDSSYTTPQVQAHCQLEAPNVPGEPHP